MRLELEVELCPCCLEHRNGSNLARASHPKALADHHRDALSAVLLAVECLEALALQR